MQIAILGPLQASVAGREVPLTGPRLRRLLVRLAVDAPKPVSVAELIDAVWKTEPPADAANALQSLVSRLRRRLADPALITAEPAGYRLGVDRSAIDLHRFVELTGQAIRLQHDGRHAEALATCSSAVDLWRGEPLTDAGDADYAQPIITSCRAHRLDLISTRIDAELDLGRGAELVPELDELINSHPLREGFVAQQLRALAAAGRVGEALAAYERCRIYLADELGADPGPELQQLHLALLRGELNARPAAAAAPVPAQRTNLRTALTSFIGREPELARIAASLASARLVTVVGPGGAGKTRIASEAARQWMITHDQPAWMIELAPVGSPEHLPGAVLDALGLGDPSLLERSERTGSDELQRLLDHLTGVDCLLVIDNCEHLVDGVARLVEELLSLAPGVRVLTTSREPLALTAETLCPLPPLTLPPPDAGVDQATESAAVRLWIDRASAIVPDYRLTEDDLPAVMEIVRRLDGLPLAIELAAARLRALPVTEIARMLSDRFRLLTGGNRTSVPRHRTLRAVVEWSWGLLTDAERLLAERLAIFPAGAGIGAATAICADERLPAAGVSELMIDLADKSLLEHSVGAPVRFRMLETIREYGVEQLADRGELDAIRSRHADHFFDLVLELEPQFRDHRQRAARLIMDQDRGNVLAALRYLIDRGDAHRALIMVLALYWHYQIRDQEQELGYWLDQVIAANAGQDDPLLIYAEALRALTELQRSGSDDDQQARCLLTDLVARLRSAPEPPFPGLEVLRARLPIFLAGNGIPIEELVERAARTGDPWVRGAIYAAASWVAENLGYWDQMAAFTEEASQAFASTGDAWGLVAVLSQRAQLLTIEGRTDQAIHELEKALELAPAIGATDDLMITHLRLAGLEIRRGNPAGARDHVRMMRSSEHSSTMDRERDLLCDAVDLSVLIAEGRYADASALADRLRNGIDDELLTHRFSAHAAAIALAASAQVELTLAPMEDQADQRENRVGRAYEDLRRGYPAAVLTQDVPIMAEFAAVVAAAADVDGRPAVAARLLGAGSALVGIDRSRDPRQVALAERLASTLGAEAFVEHFGSGRRLSRAEAVDVMDPARL